MSTTSPAPSQVRTMTMPGPKAAGTPGRCAGWGGRGPCPERGRRYCGGDTSVMRAIPARSPRPHRPERGVLDCPADRVLAQLNLDRGTSSPRPPCAEAPTVMRARSHRIQNFRCEPHNGPMAAPTRSRKFFRPGFSYEIVSIDGARPPSLHLTRVNAIAMVAGTIIGASIFVQPSEIARHLDTPGRSCSSGSCAGC